MSLWPRRRPEPGEPAELLRERERQLAEAQALAHVGSWEIRPGERRAVWSRELCRIAGRPEGFSPTTEQFLELVHPEDRPRVAEAMEQALAGEPDELDYRIVRPGGEVRHVHSRRHVRRGRDGTVSHVFGAMQDVTEHQRAEAGLRREQDFAAAILRSMHEGFMLTREGRILQVNDAFCTLTGYAREDLVGAKVPYPFWPPEARADIEQVREQINRGELRGFETTYMRRDGARLPVSVTSVVAWGPDGELIGYVSTVRDITEQKRYQSELERLAIQDHLTGLLNHRAFHERLRDEVSRALRHGRPLSVALLDVDCFKQVNDQHGHLAGDRVLRETAMRLTPLVRSGEHLARIGGDEFAWILSEAEGLGAFAAAERARSAVRSRPFAGVGEVTMSAGVCELADAGDAEQLFRRADQALYWAKTHGRNRTFRYSQATARQLIGDTPPED